MNKRISILAGILAVAVSIGAQSAAAQKAQDDFAGTGAVSSSWTSLGTSLTRSNGMLISQGTFGILRRNDVTVGAAQYSEGVWGVSAVNIQNGQSHLFVRMANADNYYMANLDDGRHTVTLVRRVAGLSSALYGTEVPSSFVKGDTIKLAIDNAFKLTVYRNGIPFLTYDDASSGRLASGGVGLGLSGMSTGKGAWDYWDGGSLASGCPLPVVTADPGSVSVVGPGTASFTVSAPGATSFQWQRGTANVVAGNGGNTATYTTPATTVMYDNASSYRAIVRNYCGADTSSPAILTVTAAPVAPPVVIPPVVVTGGGTPSSVLPLSDNFENADATCWASRPNAAGTENRAGCGVWKPIADPPYGSPASTLRLLSSSPAAHSGTRALEVIYNADEDLSFAQYNFSEDHIFFSQWIYFDANFDFALGQKIGRIDQWDSARDASLSSHIIVVYSASRTTGRDDMGGLTMARNGGVNYGYADGNLFKRGVWYHLECELKLNTPGLYDGLARVWVNDALVVQKTGMGGSDMRPNGSDTHRLSFARIGGWYSNSGQKPSSPSKYYIDDVGIDKAYIK